MPSNPLTTVDFVAGGLGGPELDIGIELLDAALRSVIFTDGTVTRALEVQALAPVTIDLVEQERAVAAGEAALALAVQDGTECIRRRVTMRTPATDPMPCVWAESHILASRLPREFVGSLNGSPQGIGESLARLRVESWRDLLWCQRGNSPNWGTLGTEPTATVTRLYRIVTNGLPALLISEAFAVYRASGRYRLVAARG